MRSIFLVRPTVDFIRRYCIFSKDSLPAHWDVKFLAYYSLFLFFIVLEYYDLISHEPNIFSKKGHFRQMIAK